MSISNFKYHMNNRFSGCLHIATTHDPYRGREVKVYMLPGDYEIVGVSDGVDVWVAPVAAEPFHNFGVRVRDLLQAVRAGTFTAPIQGNPVRRRILVNETQQLTAALLSAGVLSRRKIIAEEPKVPVRRRIINA